MFNNLIQRQNWLLRGAKNCSNVAVVCCRDGKRGLRAAFSRISQRHPCMFRASWQLKLIKIQQGALVYVCVCVCTCYTLTTRTLIRLAKWGHFVWSSQLQMTVLGLRLDSEVGVKIGLGVRVGVIQYVYERPHNAYGNQKCKCVCVFSKIFID